MDSRHDFPHQCRELIFRRYFERNNLSEHYLEIFENVWSDFISRDYAQTHPKTKFKKRIE